METNSLLNSIRKPKNIDLLYLTMLNGLSMKTELTRDELHRIFRNYKNDIRVCVTSVSENGKYN